MATLNDVVRYLLERDSGAAQASPDLISAYEAVVAPPVEAAPAPEAPVTLTPAPDVPPPPAPPYPEQPPAV